GKASNWVIDWLAVQGTSLTQPWMIWQSLTYGFLHNIASPWHLGFNMLGLFVFGRMLERDLGRMEFLRFYLVSVIFAGVVGAITYLLSGGGSAIGASGGVIALTVLFAFKYPHEQILLMMIAPVPAWLLASGYVTLDVLRTFDDFMGTGENRVAFTVHLGGAAFAALYFKLGLKLDFLAPAGLMDLPQQLRKRMRRAKLKIHDPDAKAAKIEQEADPILEKVFQHGEESLTASERKILERYSRHQQSKKRTNG
ncbi:MAG: rhomboid family intramembrane serine protease, partial [Planctomycetota bacterium]